MANPFRRLPDGGLGIWTWIAVGLGLVAVSAVVYLAAFGMAVSNITSITESGGSVVVEPESSSAWGIAAAVAMAVSALSGAIGIFMVLVGTLAKAVEVGRRSSPSEQG